MRAKLRVGSIIPFGEAQETVTFHGVSKSDGYPADGTDENNTFAKFSPSAKFDIVIANPALIGKFEVGDTFYADLTPAPK
ncbi:MAG: hypothetical protein DI527_24575 [Chelatococcus sp.]|nr:MAG: hypothetical protein DI527_24575 [Chelatococcus sp.]